MLRSFHSVLGFGAKKKSVQKINKLWRCADVSLEALEDRSVPASFTAGNLAVLLSDGNTAAATTVHLVEYNTTGTAQTAIQTIDLPATAAAAPGNGALTQAGNSTTEGFISRTQDKQYLIVTGYNAASGTASIAGSTVDRIVGRVAVDGSIDTTTRAPGLSGGNIRSAASKDGATIYVAGSVAASGLTSLAFGTQPTTANVITALNSRQVGVFGDTLFDTSSSGSNIGVNLVGTAGTLPTSAATATLIGSTSAALGFYALDRDAGVPGIDEVFVADTTNGIRKFSFNGTAWTLQGTLTGTGNFNSVAIAANGSGTDIYATTGSGVTAANNLVKYTDTAAYNAAASFSTATVLATAVAGKAFRGVTFTPEAGLPASTTTVVGSPASPQNQGTAVSFTATVSGSPNDGTVTFYAGPGLTNQIGAPVTVAAGSATSAATTALPGGVNTISAVYSGGASFAGSTGTTSYSINANTTTTVAGTPNSPQTVGTSVTFTATVSGSPSVGTVTFYAGPGLTNQIGGPVAVASGSATSAATTTLPVGTNTISAVYSGGALFLGSTGTTPYTISPVVLLNTTTVVSANPNGEQPYGTQFTFSATVTSSGSPTGTVNFSDGATLLGSGTLNGSHVATFTTTAALTVGVHSISAFYVGDSANGSSTGQTSQTITYAAGDLIVTRVGTGTGSLTANATATFLENYTPAGTQNAGNTVALPVVSGSAFGVGGTTTTEGYLNLAADGHTVSIAGYNQVPGSATTSAVREIGLVTPNGAVDLSTQMPSATGSVRSAISADGQGFWIASTTGLRYVPLGNAAATASTQVNSFFATLNGVAISSIGQLYIDAGAGAQAALGLPAIDGPATVGVGLPTNAGQAASILLGFPTANVGGFPTPNQFAISPDGNTIFVADSRITANGGLLEFFQGSPGQWTNVLGSVGFPIGTPGADSGLRGLSVDFTDPANPIIYATTSAASANRLVKITGGTTDGNTPGFAFTTLATAPANEAYRGVSLAPMAAGAISSNASFGVSANTGDYGTGVTLTAHATQGATGWVSFRQNGVEIGAAPLLPGPSQFDMANFVTAGNLGAGTYDIVAVYTGNSSLAPSTSAPITVKINKASTTTDVALSSSSVGSGTSVTLTATITVPAGTSPVGAGTVTFKDGATTLNVTPATVTQSIVGGVIKFTATFAATFSTLGTHNITAVYNGDTNFLTSTSPVATVTVVSASTTVVTTNNANPAASGASVMLTATVTGTGATPTGTVQFYDNLLPIGGPVDLSSGVATTSLTTDLLQATGSLTPGLHSITAIYSGDGTYFTSTGVYQQAVKAQPFGADSQFIYRVGDGTTNLIAQAPNPIAGSGSIGSTIFIDEYAPGGTLVQSLILPSADGTGAQSAIHAVVGNGQQSNTGQMSLSGDGRYLFLVGYDNNPLNVATAGALPTQATAVNTPRAIARIKFDGTIQSIGFVAGANGVETAGNMNGVYSPDGNQFYIGGVASSGTGTGGVFYFSSFTPSTALQAATATITGASTAVGGLHGVGGNLTFATLGTGTNLVQQYTGFPTAAATSSPLPGVSFANSAQASAFTVDAYFTHLEGPGAPAGINTMYIADDGPSFALGAITKWSLVAGTWVNTYAVGGVQGTTKEAVVSGTGNSALNFYWLSGVTDDSGNVTLAATYGNGGNANTGPGILYNVLDFNGYNAPIGIGGNHSDSVFQVASVPTGSNESFRGVASAPKPLATVTTLAATPNASTGGQLVTFTASVVPSPGALGTVNFMDGGTTLAANVTLFNGVATFQTSTLTEGTHLIQAAYSGDTTVGFAAGTSNTLSYVVSPPAANPPTLSTFTLNGGAAAAAFGGTQHSRIVNATLTFDQAVTLDANAIALALHTNSVFFGGVAQPSGVGAIPALNVATSDNTTYTVTFLPGANAETGVGPADTLTSLKDGVYELNIDATKVHPVGSPGVNMAVPVTKVFHRLFGDIDNPDTSNNVDYSTVVNSGDNFAFRTAFNKPTPAPEYRAYFDSDGSGNINSGDNFDFRTRFNKTLAWKV